MFSKLIFSRELVIEIVNYKLTQKQVSYLYKYHKLIDRYSTNPWQDGIIYQGSKIIDVEKNI